MLTTLIAYAIILPLDSIAAQKEESPEDTAIISEEENEVPVFAEDNSDSEVLTYLSAGNEVTVIETAEQFSLIELENEENGEEPIQGYVESNYLNSPDIGEDNSGDDIDNGDEAEHQDQPDPGAESSTDQEETQNNKEGKSQLAKEGQTNYSGIALKKDTNVYAKDSTEAKVLKSYPEGSILKYRSFNTDWYEATVIINGKKIDGYIQANDVENAESEQKTLQGIGTTSPTAVYDKASAKSKQLKTYEAGSILKFKTFSKNWYEAVVIIKGKKITGYIHKSDIESVNTKQESLRGIALQTVPVYVKASKESGKHKSYAAGTVLKYKTFSNNWHEAVVYINGKKKTGYIYASDVEDAALKQENLRGVSIKTTPIYQKAATNSKKLKSYSEGTILKYKSFTKNWHEAVIYLNGKKTTGYIDATDVETADAAQKDLQGVTFKEKGTNVYSKASTKSTALKSYAYGTVLKYKSFTNSWYEATIIDNGKKKLAYIHKNDVKNMDYQFTGFAQKNPTYIYADKSKKSQTLKTYDRGATLKYRALDRTWNVVTVKVKGEWLTGYLHTDDVHYEMLDLIYKTNYGYDFKAMADRQVKKQPTSDGSGKVKATRGEIEFYTNPANFPKTSAEYYQFLVLSTPAGLDAKQINDKILKGKGSLEGTAQAFINAGKKYSINEAYLIAHALHETGNGKSSLSQGIPVDKTGKVTKDKNGKIAKTKDTKHTVYNMFGYGAKDACPIECGAQYAFDHGWFTIEESIYGGIESIHSYISRGQNTLYKMRWNPDGGMTPPAIPEWYQYATHTQWAVIQTRRIAEIYNLLEEYVIEIDVPTFGNVPKSGTTTPNSLVMRSKADKNATSVSTIPKGSTVNITGSNVNAWYKVSYNGKTGWVEAKYVNLKYN